MPAQSTSSGSKPVGVVPPTLITSSPPASAMPSMSGSSATESSHASTSSGMSNAFLANALRILGHQGEKQTRTQPPPEPPPDAPAATGLAVPSAGNYNVPALPGSTRFSPTRRYCTLYTTTTYAGAASASQSHYTLALNRTHTSLTYECTPSFV